ncbi:hypothetical protein [Lelliottia nimipressuralis]|uniref:Uncharacterized protein n=1 Tax=Lelliottia nimipressuralis TaxID=69220 RepID=A0ABD4KCS3_9ENTR|nr:hypothetical protein [Lelliottia nimipressuralis]MBF4178905.1 hypothetical protein [Lelliottia nimipressuralis]
MSKPWEKYQQQSAPWEKYQQQTADPESLWSDFKRGAEQLAENYVTSVSGYAQRLNNPGEAILHPELVAAGHLDGIHPYSDRIAAPQTITGSLVEALPTVAASVPGTNAALADLETMTLPTLLKWAKRGLAASIGGDLSSGTQMTPENLAAGTGANMLMEGVFHIPAGLKGVVDRIEGNNAEALAAADRLGVPLTVGNVTRRPWLQTMEQAVSKMPGARAISDTYRKQLEILGQIIDRRASELGVESSPNALGAAIKVATEQYVSDFKEQASALYEKAFNKVGKVSELRTPRFSRELLDIAGRYKGSALEGEFDSPFVRKALKLFGNGAKVSESQGQKAAIMQLRHARELTQDMNEAISGKGDFLNMSDAQLTRMRGALSEDIEQMMSARGAGKQWQQAKDHYAAGRSLYEEALKSYDLTANADNLYTQIFGNPGGGVKAINLTDANALKATMPTAVWDKVKAEILTRMGEEGAGSAGADGRKFSPAVFMTNWTKLKDAGVTDTLFGGDLGNALDDVVKVSDALKASGMAKNFSNTAHVAAITSWLTSAATALLTGHPVSAAAAAVGTPLAGAGLGRLLTNPAAARALVDVSTAVEQPAIQKVANRLAVILIAHPELAAALGRDSERN